jgi:hypothetical protein
MIVEGVPEGFAAARSAGTKVAAVEDSQGQFSKEALS